uniref:Diphthine--ammonia ligase n=1 Tax=Spumella elongata TaxID=89044 RepID=A0A7S3GWQ3_9STRA
MKFVALLSGGKDSCFNVIKCVEHGHELICLANLSPPASFDGEEMDSFMYQTAGHTAISKLSECFEVPLIRKEILGSAVNQKLDYLSEVAADEVEDMFVLLQQVKQQYPEVEGVSCGAIVSTYQRLRVESICQRLGLTVLSYLWQRDRVELLQEMITAGVDAVLVKVAGAGLEPHKHLGKSLAVLQPTLMKLHEQFG